MHWFPKKEINSHKRWFCMALNISLECFACCKEIEQACQAAVFDYHNIVLDVKVGMAAHFARKSLPTLLSFGYCHCIVFIKAIKFHSETGNQKYSLTCGKLTFVPRSCLLDHNVGWVCVRVHAHTQVCMTISVSDIWEHAVALWESGMCVKCQHVCACTQREAHLSSSSSHPSPQAHNNYPSRRTD